MNDDDASLDALTELANLRGEVATLRTALDAERALRHAVVDHAPDFVVHCDLEGTILFINRVAPGFDPAKVVGTNITAFAPPEHTETIMKCVEQVATTGQQAEFESQAIGAYGQMTHFHNRLAPVNDGDEVTSLVLFVSDVGQLKNTERELRDRKARLRVVLEAARMGVCEIDVERRVLQADERFRAILGMQEETIAVDDFFSLLVPEDRPRVAAALEAAITSGTYRMLDFRVALPSGAQRWIRGAGQLRTEGGRAVVIGSVVDIDDEKRLEVQLLQAQKLESIGRLAGGVAHDFNNLLTAILGSVAIAEESVAPDAAVREELGEIRRGAERGAALTSQLLAFARKQVIEPKVISLSALVAGVERLLGRVLGEGVELATMCQAEGKVLADPHQIERVLINLATNARDAMPRGGRLTIETADVSLDETYVATHADATAGPHVMLVVSDTGHGMTAEALSHVFEPFYTTKGFEMGTGLGLPTCYGIVRQVGGFIQVYSEVGHGTTFRVYLPRVGGELHTPVPPRPTVAAPATETVLLVEDDATIRRVVARTLRGFGYTVLEAPQAEAALAIASAHEGTIHVLITDVVMPGMGGRELSRCFAALRPDAAVLYVSGYTENAIVHHGVLDEGVDFLQKPFSPSTLNARIRRLLDGRGR